MQQGPFAPRALPRFNATTDPAATVSSSTVFPGPPVMRSTLLRRFLDGTTQRVLHRTQRNKGVLWHPYRGELSFG